MQASTVRTIGRLTCSLSTGIARTNLVGSIGVVAPILAKRQFSTTTPGLSKDGDAKKPTKKKSTYPRIYTRTGDEGNSSLFSGERRSKSDVVFEALGTTDELSSHIGLAMEYANDSNHPYAENLQRIQCILQDIGSCVATPFSSAREAHLDKVGFSSRHVDELEEWIDEYSKDLPPLQNFILPGGGKTSASLHVARSVCRRAERCVVPLVQAKEVDGQALKYLNRLSDFLFTIARYAAWVDKHEETIYRRPDIRSKPPYKSGPDGVWKKSKTEKT